MSGPLLKRKPVKLLVMFTLACIVLLPIACPLQEVSAQSQEQTQYYSRQFSWDYGGNHWNWNLSIPVSLYAAYKAVPQPVRARLGPEDFGFFTTTQDTYIQTIAQKLNQTANDMGYNSYDQVNFVLAFVQSIPYKTDNESTPYQVYPRFPVETLVDDVGDCKAHSALFATLTLYLGYGTIYINPPNHLAVGVLGNNLDGAYWTYNNKTYYYCETTGAGFKIGQLPDQFIGVKANVDPIYENQQYSPNSDSITTIDPEPTLAPTTPKPTATKSATSTPEPTATASPSVSGPTVQPVKPMSLNLISEAPLLFILIVVAIVLCIFLAVRSAKTSKGNPAETPPELPQPETQEASAEEANKFCIYCGAPNKSYATYCEKCGKQIA
jgi:ribosomal protein L40E